MTDIRPSLPVKTYRDFIAGQSLLDRARGVARKAAILALSAGRSPDDNEGWIRFPFYHHIFDDERPGFARQLDFMASHGDFIGLDDAVNMLESGASISGRYFCVSFDDGFKNWITNAVPILLDHGVPAAFFVAAGYIGTSVERDREKLLGFYDSRDLLMEFLSWDDCREMADAGMTIGSHTMNHVHLIDLDDDGVEAELADSKQLIEAELGKENINVNSIAPGNVATPLNAHLRGPGNEEYVELMRTFTPTGIAFLEPEDMTGTAVFLASDDSKLIHGETIVVDGGWSVW